MPCFFNTDLAFSSQHCGSFNIPFALWCFQEVVTQQESCQRAVFKYGNKKKSWLRKRLKVIQGLSSPCGSCRCQRGEIRKRTYPLIFTEVRTRKAEKRRDWEKSERGLSRGNKKKVEELNEEHWGKKLIQYGWLRPKCFNDRRSGGPDLKTFRNYVIL